MHARITGARARQRARMPGIPACDAKRPSILLALIVGLIVTAYAYWLTGWVPSGHRFL